MKRNSKVDEGSLFVCVHVLDRDDAGIPVVFAWLQCLKKERPGLVDVVREGTYGDPTTISTIALLQQFAPTLRLPINRSFTARNDGYSRRWRQAKVCLFVHVFPSPSLC